MNKRVIFLLIIIGFITISSCQKTSAKGDENFPGVDVPNEELNQKFELLSYPGMPEFHKNGEMLAFLVRNKSNESIIFNQDFGLLVLLKQGSNWKQVENKWGYPEGEIILPPYARDPTGLVLTVMPELGSLQEETTVRIIAIGRIKDKPDEQVGAYIDVMYEP